MAVGEVANGSMISNVTVDHIELNRRMRIEVPDETEGQIVLNPSTNIVVGQIEVQVPESHLPGAAFTLGEVPFVERRLVPLGDD